MNNITYPAPAGKEGFEYDKDSNLKTWTKSDGRQVTYQYNKNNDLEKLSSGTFTIEMDYDSLNRVEQSKTNDGTRSETTRYLFQDNYLLAGVVSPRGHVSYHYDDADRLIKRGVGIQLQGFPPGVFGFGNLETTFTYNERDELTSAIQDGQRVGYDYNKSGDLISTTLPNGIVGRQNFSLRHNLLRLEYQKGGDTPLYSLTYDHNQLGQRRRYHHMAPDRSDLNVYGYNSRDELTNANVTRAGTTQTRTYSYDNNHNRTQLSLRNTGADFTSAYGNNAADQMMTGQNLTWGYNGAGARNTQTGPQTYTADFDTLDRMVAYRTAGTNATYRYNGSNLRTEKTVSNSTANVTTRYLYDGSDQLAELDDQNQARLSYFLGAAREGFKAVLENQWFWYLTDAQGSVLAVTDATGQVRERVEYPDPYGEPKILSNTIPDTLHLGNDNRFFYTGEMRDAESGFVYLHNRYYDTRHGRFISRDPIRHAGGLNMYAYCENDPLNHSDPSGLQEVILLETPWWVRAGNYIGRARAMARPALTPRSAGPVESSAEPGLPVPAEMLRRGATAKQKFGPNASRRDGSGMQQQATDLQRAGEAGARGLRNAQQGDEPAPKPIIDTFRGGRSDPNLRNRLNQGGSPDSYSDFESVPAANQPDDRGYWQRLKDWWNTPIPTPRPDEGA